MVVGGGFANFNLKGQDVPWQNLTDGNAVLLPPTTFIVQEFFFSSVANGFLTAVFMLVVCILAIAIGFSVVRVAIFWTKEAEMQEHKGHGRANAKR